MLRRITHPFSSRPTSLPSTIPLPFTPANFNEIKYAVTKFRNKANMAKNILLFGRMNTWITTHITNMSELFSEFVFDNINDIISGWDVSNVRNMSRMFNECDTFLQPLHGWNVSLVEDMSLMFRNCSNFNSEISGWSVSNVKDMHHMFSGCSVFNQNLNNWNVAKVEFFQYMFLNCVAFKQSLSNWNVSNGKDMAYMFYNCYIFNRPLNSWNVSNVTDMTNMFYFCATFNQPLFSWNVSNVDDMRNMFYSCANFNQNLNSWNVKETAMVMGMFSKCRLAPEMYPNNIRQKLISQMSSQELSDLRRTQLTPPVQQPAIVQPIVQPAPAPAPIPIVQPAPMAVQLQQIIDQRRQELASTRPPFKPLTYNELKHAVDLFRNKEESQMRKNVQQFGKMDTWELQHIPDMHELFSEFVFDNVNDIITDWIVGGVENMSRMFYKCTTFNQRIKEWDVQNVVNMSEMFYNCTIFNQDLNYNDDDVNDPVYGWNVSYVKNMNGMFANCIEFNQPLDGWDVSSVIEMSQMFENCTKFNQPLNNWKVQKVEYMNNMFFNCIEFNQPLEKWKVSSIFTMNGMFYNCAKFNQPLNNWEAKPTWMNHTFYNCVSFNYPLDKWCQTTYGEYMSYTFYNCVKFDQPLNTWKVNAVKNMNNMFYNCIKFNQPLDNWKVGKVNNMSNMFYHCTKFNQNLTGWKVNARAICDDMFKLCKLAPEMYPDNIRQELIDEMSSQELAHLRSIQHIPPLNNTILNKVTATPIVLSNSPITSLTPQTTMYNSIELENINVVKYLKENANNLVFYYNNAFYPINKTNLFAFTADGNKVKFKCNQVYSILYITPDKYDIANPYLLGSSFSCPCGLLLLSQIKTILNSPDQLFEIIHAGTTAPSTVSYQMTTPQANAVGASHCQEGQGANINNIVKHTIPDFPENLQEEAVVVPDTDNTIGVNYKDITYKFGITPETTVGEFKKMVLDKLVLENQIDNVNKKVRFLYSGKIIQVDSQILLQIPSVAFGVTFNVLISPNVAGGTRRIKRRGKRRVTKKIIRRKKTRRIKRRGARRITKKI